MKKIKEAQLVDEQNRPAPQPVEATPEEVVSAQPQAQPQAPLAEPSVAEAPVEAPVAEAPVAEAPVAEAPIEEPVDVAPELPNTPAEEQGEGVFKAPMEGMVPSGWVFPDELAQAVAMVTGDVEASQTAPDATVVPTSPELAPQEEEGGMEPRMEAVENAEAPLEEKVEDLDDKLDALIDKMRKADANGNKEEVEDCKKRMIKLLGMAMKEGKIDDIVDNFATDPSEAHPEDREDLEDVLAEFGYEDEKQAIEQAHPELKESVLKEAEEDEEEDDTDPLKMMGLGITEPEKKGEDEEEEEEEKPEEEEAPEEEAPVEEAPEAEGYKFEAELTQLINGEAVCAVQYKIASESIVGPDQSYLVDHFSEHADEEWGHYSTLVKALMERTGKNNASEIEKFIADAKPEKKEIESFESEYLRKFFVDAEEEAVRAYQEFYDKIEEEDKDLADIINAIIADEREHKLDFTRIVEGLNESVEDIEAPVDEVGAEEAPVEEAPVEEIPSEEAPVEEIGAEIDVPEGSEIADGVEEMGDVAEEPEGLMDVEAPVEEPSEEVSEEEVVDAVEELKADVEEADDASEILDATADFLRKIFGEDALDEEPEDEEVPEEALEPMDIPMDVEAPVEASELFDGEEVGEPVEEPEAIDGEIMEEPEEEDEEAPEEEFLGEACDKFSNPRKRFAKKEAKVEKVKEACEINSDNAWDMYDKAIEYLGAEELLLNLMKALSTDDLEDLLRYIKRVYEIEEKLPVRGDKGDYMEWADTVVAVYLDGKYEEFCEWLARAMGQWKLADNLEYIFRCWDIPCGDEEEEAEYEESVKMKEEIFVPAGSKLKDDREEKRAKVSQYSEKMESRRKANKKVEESKTKSKFKEALNTSVRVEEEEVVEGSWEAKRMEEAKNGTFRWSDISKRR